MKLTPEYKHYCPKCKFIGQTTSEGKNIDWYLCGQSILGRYGNEDPEYWSSLTSIVESIDQDVIRRDHYLQMAILIWKKYLRDECIT